MKLKKVLVSCAAVTLLVSSTLGVSAVELKDLFDAKYYAEKYPDVVAAYGEDADALYEHYTTFGVNEGRKASELFDVENYRKQYADLDKAFGDDWGAYVHHYLTFGLKEERDGGGEFDAVSYAKRYPDVYAEYGYDVAKLHEHYQVFGTKEGRNPESAKVEADRKAAERARAAAAENQVDPEVKKAIGLLESMETHYAAYRTIAKGNPVDLDWDALDEEREKYNDVCEQFTAVADKLMGDCGWPEELAKAFQGAMDRLEKKFGDRTGFGGMMSAG